MHTKPFSIILVNYRTKRLTSVCLELLKLNVDPERTDVVVVDNGSNDESLEYLRSLDWITLVERNQPEGEPPFISHGEALDEGMNYIRHRFVCLLHTDTFIHNPRIFDLLLQEIGTPGVAAVGSLDQRHRPIHRRLFRIGKRAFRYSVNMIKFKAGINAIPPKPFRDVYLKSFCCMWDADLIRKEKLFFSLNGQNPGYFMQDELSKRGFKFIHLNTRLLFGFLDHVQSGTVVEANKAKHNPRRAKEYERVMLRISSTG